MTKFPYDDFAKSFLETLLSPFGKVEPSYKIAAEVREVDVYFIPSSNNLNRTDLGLLGKCATDPVVITRQSHCRLTGKKINPELKD
jgi:hypothetical protein